MAHNLILRAGAAAQERLVRDGFDPKLFSTMLGASGGPKWLVLSHIDRVLARRFVTGRRRRLNLLGSSIGAWRHAALARREPVAAVEEFERLYIGQAWDKPPSPGQVTDDSCRMLGILFGDRGRDELLASPDTATHIITVRSKGPLACERRGPLAFGVATAALANMLGRRSLGALVERVVFGHDPQAFGFKERSTRYVGLSPDNLDDALLASGAIPLVMTAPRDIAGAPAGVYRDGGILDYHFDFSFTTPPGLVLFPHFFDRIVPGWFDKRLSWRRVAPKALDQVLMIAPSPAFIAGLPGARIPDRRDFARLSTRERQTRWRQVVDSCRRLGDELEELLESGQVEDRLVGFD
ncbi:MAG: patatin-like phospholipase family protein [Deltaproteobacteria bacterium]